MGLDAFQFFHWVFAVSWPKWQQKGKWIMQVVLFEKAGYIIAHINCRFASQGITFWMGPILGLSLNPSNPQIGRRCCRIDIPDCSAQSEYRSDNKRRNWKHPKWPWSSRFGCFFVCFCLWTMEMPGSEHSTMLTKLAWWDALSQAGSMASRFVLFVWLEQGLSVRLWQVWPAAGPHPTLLPPHKQTNHNKNHGDLTMMRFATTVADLAMVESPWYLTKESARALPS